MSPGRRTNILGSSEKSSLDSIPRFVKIVIPILFIAIPLYFWFSSRPKTTKTEPAAITGTSILLASPGRVEGLEETIALGAAADGVVKAVHVTAGQHVAAGDVLAEIDCDDLKAEIEQAKAEAESARQSRVRLIRGHRDEERAAAAQNTAAAQSTLEQAKEHFERIDSLYQKDAVARDLFEETKRDYEVAQANYAMYRATQDLIDAPPLPEEVAKADADVASAEKNISATTEKLRKCWVRAPFSGTVLKVMARVGEAYSTLLPRPLFSFANDSARRVRAEVDEWDIGKVKPGQRAIVTADGFPGRRFEGRVVELAHVMGRKSVLSGDPAEKADRDVLEVTVGLDPSAKVLPVGLRITAQFLNSIEKTGISDNLGDSAPTGSGGPPQPEADSKTSVNAPLLPKGTIRIQVAAMEDQSGALAMAEVLQIKKFPAFVIPPGRDKYYHVQVGPYPDEKSAAIAQRLLKAQGFESILKKH